jgi:putative RecB family exonuclease
VSGASGETVTVEGMEKTLLDLTLPSTLSPSRASEYQGCPRRYWYHSVLRLPDPPTVHTLLGTVVHSALEHLFDLPRGQRTADKAQAQVTPALAELATQEQYLDLIAEHGDRIESEARDLVARYFEIEDPNRFDPWGRELRLSCELAGVEVLGVIDRIDKVLHPDGVERVWISDYKSGKPVSNKYLEKAFFGLRVYAVLAADALGLRPYALRLVYLRGDETTAIRRLEVTDELLERTRKELARIWRSIERSAETGVWKTKTGPLCNWCPYQVICPAFAASEAPESYIPVPFDPAQRRPRRDVASEPTNGTSSEAADMAVTS